MVDIRVFVVVPFLLIQICPTREVTRVSWWNASSSSLSIGVVTSIILTTFSHPIHGTVQKRFSFLKWLCYLDIVRDVTA